MFFSSTMGTGVSRSIRSRPSDDKSPIACENIKVEFKKEFTSVDKAAEMLAQKEAKEKEQIEKTKGKPPSSEYSPHP